MIIIDPANDGSNSHKVEVVPLKEDLRSFRILAAAYLLQSMPKFIYLSPPIEPMGKYVFWLPPRHYDDAPLTDEQVFQTKHRHSDFDILKLIDDRERALQFFRWKRYVEKTVSPHITSVDDEIECITNEFDRQYHPPRGLCWKPIPTHTLQHMKSVLRPNTLSSELLSAVKNSKRFTIKLGRALGDPITNRIIARVHLCRITSIDGRPVENSPEIVMKIFDDRFMENPSPYNEDGLLEDDVSSTHLSEWFETVLTAEWHVRGELTALEKMEMAQGSLIPYFYGAHKVGISSSSPMQSLIFSFNH